MHMTQRVLVVGGGVAGLTAAVSLAQRGHAVTLVEREQLLGGQANTVCCKAINGVCQLCGACLLADALEAAGHQAGLDMRTGTRLQDLSRADGALTATLLSPAGSVTLPVRPSFWLPALTTSTRAPRGPTATASSPP